MSNAGGRSRVTGRFVASCSLFDWGIDTNTFPFIDVETIALHEMDHGLGQAHFGTAFLALANGRLRTSPGTARVRRASGTIVRE